VSSRLVPGRTEGTKSRKELLATLDPDADEQRWYTCNGCGWPCINPIGTLPEKRELCVDCTVENRGQSTLRDY